MKKFLGIVVVIAIIAVILYAIGFFENNDSIPDNTEVCRVCEGSKICSVCDGDGVLELSEPLGGPRKCSFCSSNPGVCRTCKGKGYMIIDD